MTTVYRIKETGTEFEMGKMFKPTRDDVSAILCRLEKFGVISDILPPKTKVADLVSNFGKMCKALPIMVDNYSHRINAYAPAPVRACMWVLACSWYFYAKGPHPAPAKKTRIKRHRAVLEFRCPYCGRVIFEPNPRFKSREVILKQFATALTKHAVECEKVLFLDRSVK